MSCQSDVLRAANCPPLSEGREGTAWESSEQRNFLTPTPNVSVISVLTATPSFLTLSLSLFIDKGLNRSELRAQSVR